MCHNFWTKFDIFGHCASLQYLYGQNVCSTSQQSTHTSSCKRFLTVILLAKVEKCTFGIETGTGTEFQEVVILIIISTASTELN